jgi:hypothetical protein
MALLAKDIAHPFLKIAPGTDKTTAEYNLETKRTETGVDVSKERKPKIPQSILWEESLQAVHLSLGCNSKSELSLRLREEFSQNSATTRARNATTVLSRFFPAQYIDQLPRRVLRLYGDEKLLADVMTVLLPMSEPVIGQLLADRLFPIEPGSELPSNFFTSYGQEIYSKNAKDIAARCSGAARVMGWVSRQGGKSYRLHRTVNQTAALILIHELYATTPRIVELSQILSEPVWKYMGFQDADQVRAFCKLMEQKQLIARYVQVDRLDQITTRYSAPELMERKMTL